MDLLNATPLSSAEARKLSAYLRGNKTADNALSFNALKGFLFGITTAPSMLPPSQWLTEVLGNPEDATDTDHLAYLELILRLYNQIAADVLEHNPKLPAGASLSKTLKENFTAGHPLYEWSSGFARALQLTAADWRELMVYLPDDVREEALECQAFLAVFADEQAARRMSNDYGDDLPYPFETFIRLMRRQMTWVLKDYAGLCREVIETLQALEASEKPLVAGAASQMPQMDRLEPSEDQGRYFLEQAMGAGTAEEAIHLAKKALDTDPALADAYLMLADLECRNLNQRIAMLERGINAVETALGETFLAENEGDFWLIWETRPYMRLLGELALAYGEKGELDRGIALEERMLRLNPNDNQAVRFSLLAHYLERGSYAAAEVLIQQYSDDQSAFFCFNRGLLGYIQKGDCAEIRKMWAEVKRYNPHVARYLSGKQKMPKDMPEFYSPGGREEAILFVAENKELWRKTLGAIPWLNRK